MKSWISIPFYLWKNTSRRWFEYPVSPLSKILIPVLLGFLSVLVLGVFALVERELQERLETSSAFTAVSTEFVQGGNAPTLLTRIHDEEMIFQQRFPTAMLKTIKQPLVPAMLDGRNIPVLAFTGLLDEAQATNRPEDPPSIRLMVHDPARWGNARELTLGSLRLSAEVTKTPDWMVSDLAMQDAVAVGIELVQAPLQKGFINHTVAQLGGLEELRRYVTEAKAFYRAEGRQVKITSALAILEDLERIRQLQRLAKTLIVIGCGVILALTLGSIAWLEYRQDSYLLALLRSFGTPSLVLLVHMFLENLTLVVAGILLVWFTWQDLYKHALPRLQEIGIHSNQVPELAVQDLWVLLVAGLSGVILAMVPVGIGLRRQPGLILQ